MTITKSLWGARGSSLISAPPLARTPINLASHDEGECSQGGHLRSVNASAIIVVTRPVQPDLREWSLRNDDTAS